MTASPGATSRLDVPGTYNFREVAPGALVPGQLFRSDALHRVTRAGRQALSDLGIHVVIDLRSDFDRRIAGRDRLRGTGAHRVAIPISGTPPGTDPAAIDLRWVYRTILTRHRTDLAAALHVISVADGPVVVHCTAGKDRTGLVVALLLTALGVDEETVVADYAATQANLAGEWTDRMLRKVRRFRVPVTDSLVEVIAHSPEPVLRDTLDWLRTEYDGAASYLAAAGVDDAVLDRLRRKLRPTPEAPHGRAAGWVGG